MNPLLSSGQLQLLKASRSAATLVTSSKRVFSSSAASQPALDVEFPGIPELKSGSEKPKPKTEVTTLGNGLRIASQETYQPNTTIGIAVRAGSRYENDKNNGVSHLLEHMAFKSTQKRSHLRLVRDLEDMGANSGAQTAREHIIYCVDVMRPHVAGAVEVLAETLLQPKMAAWDLDEQRKAMSFELEDIMQNPQALLTESIHAAAFGDGSQLGRPMWCPQRNLHKLTPEVLHDYKSSHFTAPRMVLTGAGIPHDELVKLGEKFFSGVPKTGPSEPVSEDSTYVGGDSRLRGDSPVTHVSMSFHVDGGWASDDLLPVCAAHLLLGGGSSFSAGGPGKGMYSRLYTNVLNQNHWVDSAAAFNAMYDDTGLMGVYGTCEPQKAQQLVDILTGELKELASKPPAAEETTRAKNQLKSSILMNLESRSVLFDDIARQMLTYGKREDPSELCKRVDNITAEQIQSAVQKILKTPLTFAAYGDVSEIKSYEAIAKSFN